MATGAFCPSFLTWWRPGENGAPRTSRSAPAACGHSSRLPIGTSVPGRRLDTGRLVTRCWRRSFLRCSATAVEAVVGAADEERWREMTEIDALDQAYRLACPQMHRNHQSTVLRIAHLQLANALSRQTNRLAVQAFVSESARIHSLHFPDVARSGLRADAASYHLLPRDWSRESTNAIWRCWDYCRRHG